MGKRETAAKRRQDEHVQREYVEQVGVRVALRMAQAGVVSFPYLPSKARRRRGLPHWARMILRGKV